MEGTIYIEEMIRRHPLLLPVKNEIERSAAVIIECFQKGGKLLACGNGGSSADSDHIVGEFMKGFEQMRPVAESLKKKLIALSADRGKYLSEKLQQGLPAISLTAHNALITAISNDTDSNLVFAQQIVGYGNPGDVLIAISSSGNSQNILDAVITARSKDMTIIGLTGKTGGKMKDLCDILINVPEIHTALVQELHLPVYHTICRVVEQSLFDKSRRTGSI